MCARGTQSRESGQTGTIGRNWRAFCRGRFTDSHIATLANTRHHPTGISCRLTLINAIRLWRLAVPKSPANRKQRKRPRAEKQSKPRLPARAAYVPPCAECENLRAQLAKAQHDLGVRQDSYTTEQGRNESLRMDLDAANSRVAELTAELEAAYNDTHIFQEERDAAINLTDPLTVQLEARVARLTAEKEAAERERDDAGNALESYMRSFAHEMKESSDAAKEELALAKANAIQPEAKYSLIEKWALLVDGCFDFFFGKRRCPECPGQSAEQKGART